MTMAQPGAVAPPRRGARTVGAVAPTALATPTTSTAGSYKWWVLVTAVFGVFVSLLDATIVNTALPKMQAVFGADLHQISYVNTAYTLSQGVVVAAAGYLANRFGIKRIYLGSLALFTAGSALCGLAWSTGILIVFRVLQGAGGAALFPLSIALIFAAFPPRERGLANGAFGIPILVAPAIGPTLGGFLAQYADWRWIFYVNVPIGIVGVLIGYRVLRESAPQRGLRFDLRGFLLLGAGLGLLLYGLSNLAYDGWDSIGSVSGPIVLAVLLLLVYVPVELRTRQPLLDLRLFTGRNFWAGNLIIWLGAIGLFGVAFLLPQYLQTLRGLDPFPAGLLLLPLGLTSMVVTILAGALYNRIGPRALLIGGAVALFVDTLLIRNWTTLDSAFGALLGLLILRGVALPPLTQTSNTMALQGVAGPDLNGASTLITVTRNVVASLAVATFTNILQTQQIVHRANIASRVSLSDPATAALYHGLVNRLESLQGLPPATAARQALAQMAGQITRQAAALAFQDVFFIAALITLPAIVLPLLLRPTRTSGRDHAAEPV